MEDALVIESKPLNPQQANTLLVLLAQSQVAGGAASEVLHIRLALERICKGKDTVVSTSTAND